MRRPLGVTHRGVEHHGGGQVTALSQKHGSGKNHHCRHHGNQQTLQDPEKGSKAEFEAGSGLWIMCWLQGSPDELGFRLDVSHAILGQGLVDTVEERPQEPAHHAHHDEEGQVHGGPQVTALVSVWTLIKRNHTDPTGSIFNLLLKETLCFHVFLFKCFCTTSSFVSE